MKTKIIEQDGIKYKVVEVVEDKNKVIVEGVGDVTDYEKWYARDYCLEAVKQNGDALQYVRDQDREICLEAVKQNGYALRYVDKRVFLDKK